MPNNVEIIMGDTPITQFTDFKLTKSIDKVGNTFSFSAPFYPDSQTYRDLYKPFKYQDILVSINDELQLTGRVERVEPILAEGSSVSISGRSKNAVIVDCTFQKSDFPIESKDAKLDEIAKDAVKSYDFGVVFETDAGPLFPEAGPASPTQTIFNYLNNYAKQRKLLMSQTPEGDLLFRRAVTDVAPVAEFREGDIGLLFTNGAYDGTRRFSSFDVFGQEPDVNDNYARVVDPALDGIQRPKSVQSNDTNSANILDSANWIASATIAESINIPLNVESWTNPSGALWTENTLIVLTAPSIMVYKPFTFLIKSVEFSRNATREHAGLKLTIPHAYTGTLPESYPWD